MWQVDTVTYIKSNRQAALPKGMSFRIYELKYYGTDIQ